jgi:hypothetical protein
MSDDLAHELRVLARLMENKKRASTLVSSMPLSCAKPRAVLQRIADPAEKCSEGAEGWQEIARAALKSTAHNSKWVKVSAPFSSVRALSWSSRYLY